MKKRTVIALIVLLFGIVGFAQNSSNFQKSVDSIFKTWNTSTQPGGAAGILKDGKILYLKGFGVANLETTELITPQTKFQLGEMSKQFTTLAILLLQEQGKINQNEDIRKYLPEMREYAHKITIGHLLNHSSGLYNVNKVHTVIKGSGEVNTQEEALKLIASQESLSFEPGTDFSFHESVTESILMAEIVARSSGMSFADFVKANIFEPLGMKNSLIRDDSNAILTKVAQPYQKEEDKGYIKLEVGSSVIGAINAYCSSEDLAKWYLNYAKPQGKLGKLIQKLDTPVQLSNGKKFVYYWGEMAIGREFSHPERGLPIFWNFGLQGGYGTNVFRYLDQNIVSFVLGNSNQYNGALAQGAIVPLVEDKYPLPANIDFKAKKIKKLSAKKLKTFEGDYWFSEGYASEIFVENDTLRSKWLFSNNNFQTLVPLSNDTFQQYAQMEDTRLFKFIKEGDNMKYHFTYNESRPDIMVRYNPVELDSKDLQSYAGTYYNQEYATLFSFHVEDEQLIVRNLNHQDITLRPVIKDVFTSTSMFFNALEFLRDNSNKVTGFSIVTDGIHNLVFNKTLDVLDSK